MLRGRNIKSREQDNTSSGRNINSRERDNMSSGRDIKLRERNNISSARVNGKRTPSAPDINERDI